MNFKIIKIAALLAAVISATVTEVLDPSIKVAIIIGISTTAASLITAMGTMLLGFMNYRLNKSANAVLGEVREHTNGMLEKLSQAKDVQAEQLTSKSDQLAHAEGYREASDAERLKKGE